MLGREERELGEGWGGRVGSKRRKGAIEERQISRETRMGIQLIPSIVGNVNTC